MILYKDSILLSLLAILALFHLLPLFFILYKSRRRWPRGHPHRSRNMNLLVGVIRLVSPMDAEVELPSYSFTLSP